jgi:hypothetical protein
MLAVKPSELPQHPDLAPAQGEGTLPDTQAFVKDVLEEGHRFITEDLQNPSVFKTVSKDKRSPPSTAPLEVRAAEIHQASVTENWFARISIHEDSSDKGTATWEEFDNGLRVDHSEHEKDYTPDLVDAHQVLSWREQLATAGGVVGEWQDVTLEIREMRHKLPFFLLDDRVFSVLVATAKKEGELLVVQLPVDLSNVPKAKYTGDSSITHGIYCSVERAEKVAEGTKWQMGTASDAGGKLPIALQKPNMPGAVAKDVGLFIKWREEQRAK